MIIPQHCRDTDPLELALIGPVIRGGMELIPMVQQLEAVGFTPDVFKSHACRALWNEAKRLDSERGYCDETMIRFGNRCEHLGQTISERSMWFSEAANFGLIAMMPYHAGALTDKRMVQDVREAVSKISGETADSVISEIENSAAAARSKAIKTDNELQAGGNELLEELDQAIEGIQLPSSKVAPWDRMMGGIVPAQFVVLAGRPGGGKSALAEQIIHQQMMCGNPVVYIQREMSRSRAIGRLAARLCDVAWSKIELKRASQAEYKLFRDCVATYMKYPLHLEPASLCNGINIGGIVRHHVRQTGSRLVVMDYLQLVDVPKGMEPRRAIGDVCRALKLAANDTGATILAIAQLNRQQDRRQTKPTLADLNESGDIERTADCVLALWEKEDREERPRYPIEWSILKNRNGGHGSSAMTFDGPSMSFLGEQIQTRENP